MLLQENTIRKFVLGLLLICISSINAQVPKLVIKNGHEGNVKQVILTEDFSRLISRDDKNHVVVWDFESQAEVSAINLSSDVLGMAMCNDKPVFISANGGVEMRSIKNLEHEKSIHISDTILDFAFSTKKIVLRTRNKMIVLDENLNQFSIDCFFEKKSHVQLFANQLIVHSKKSIKLYELGDEKVNTTNEFKHSGMVKEIISVDSQKNIVLIDKLNQVQKFNLVDKKAKRYFFDLPTTAGVRYVKNITDSTWLILSREPMFYLVNQKLDVVSRYGITYRSIHNLTVVPKLNCFIYTDGTRISKNDLTSGREIGSYDEEFSELSLIDFSKDGEALIIGASSGSLRYVPLNPIDKEYYYQIPLSDAARENGWNIFPSKLLNTTENEVEFEAIKFRIRKNRIEERITFTCIWDLQLNHLRMTELSIARFNKKDSETDRSLNGLKSTYFSISEKANEKYNLNLKLSSKNVIQLNSLDSNVPLQIAFFSTGKKIYLRGDYYFAQKAVSENVAFVDKDGNSYQMDQFDPFFNRPDYIFEGFNFVDSGLVTMYKKARIKRWKKLNLSDEMPDLKNVPEIEISKSNDYYIDESTYKFNVKSTDKFKLSALHVTVNNVPYYGISGLEVNSKNLAKEIEIELTKGLNRIKVFTENTAGIYSRIVSFEIFNESKIEQNLFIVSIGVSNYKDQQFKLNYASKDANDFATGLADNSLIYENINSLVLTDEKFDESGLTEIQTFLKPSKTNDVIVFYYAGHGVLDQNYDYYLCPASTNFLNPETTAIKFDVIEEMLTNTASRNRIIILDACHSGELDKDELASTEKTITETKDLTFRSAGNAPKLSHGNQSIFEFSKSLFIDTRLQKGNMILASSSGLEFSMEGNKWQNGLFTYFVLEGMKTKVADLNNDNKLYLYELIAYVSDKVTETSMGAQNPTLREDNPFVNIRLY